MITKGALMKKITRFFLVLLLLCASVVAAQAASTGHADSGALLKDYLYRTFNFAVMVGILGYLLAKPFRNAMSGRREGIAKALSEAEKIKAEAEAKFAEYDRKLQAATDEIDEIYASIKKEGEAERDRIIENAKIVAARIKEDAQKGAEEEIRRAKQLLQEEAARLAVGVAEELLKKNITAADQSRLVGENIMSVGEIR